MTVRTKLISTFVIFDLILTLLVSLGTYLIINDRATFIEDQYASKNIERLREIINSDIGNLSQTNKDYAYWDDTYQFINDHNKAYRQTNLTQVNFGDTLNLDFVYFVNTDKELVASWHNQDADIDPEPKDTASIAAMLEIYNTLQAEGYSEPEGIVMLPMGLSFVSVKAVLPSNRGKDRNGYMAIGYRVDDEKLKDISNRLQLPVTFEPIDDSATDKPYSFEKKSDLIQGKLYVSDVLGQHHGYFLMSMKRDIYASARMTFAYIIVLMVVLFVVSTGFVVAFSKTVFGSILHRISHLSLRARSAVTSNFEMPIDCIVWENNQDELGELARSLDKMRELAYQATHELQQTVEEKTKVLSQALKKEEKTSEAMMWLLDREKKQNDELEKKEADLRVLAKDLRKVNDDLKTAIYVNKEFVNIATHQLKNPLFALGSFAKMIKQGLYGKVPKSLNEPLQQIYECTEQSIALVEDMLKISRSGQTTTAVPFGPVNLADTVLSVKQMVEAPLSQKKMKLEYVASSTAPIVIGDKDKIRDVVFNLVSNAIKYSESGTITISHKRVGSVIETIVTDEGYGISKADLKKVFSQFFRSPENVVRGIPGTGLGLYIVRQYLESMSGSIKLTSVLGKGSTFTFSLPKA